jgi:putative redox protein
MVSFHLVYEGHLRCEAAHDASGVRIVTDAPVDNHGRGGSFSPTDLVATGLGVCMLTTIGIATQDEQITLDGSRVYVEKHMSADPPRRIARIVVRIEIAAGIAKDQRSRIEHIARTCPVAKSIHPDISVDLQFAYPD